MKQLKPLSLLLVLVLLASGCDLLGSSESEASETETASIEGLWERRGDVDLYFSIGDDSMTQYYRPEEASCYGVFHLDIVRSDDSQYVLLDEKSGEEVEGTFEVEGNVLTISYEMDEGAAITGTLDRTDQSLNSISPRC